MLIGCIIIPVKMLLYDITDTALRKPMAMCTMIVIGSLLFRLAAEQIEHSILLLNHLQVPHTDWTNKLTSHPYVHFGLLIVISWIDLIVFNFVRKLIWNNLTLPTFMTHPMTNFAWFRFNIDAALDKQTIKDVTNCAETLRVLNVARCKLTQSERIERRQDMSVHKDAASCKSGGTTLVRTRSTTRAGTPFKTFTPVSVADTATPMFSQSSSSLWSSTVSTRWTTRASTPGRDDVMTRGSSDVMASVRSSRSNTPMPGHDLHPAAGDSVTQLLTPRMMSSARFDRCRSPATPPLSNANFRQTTPPLSNARLRRAPPPLSNAHLCRVTPYADYPCSQRLSTMETAAGSSAPTSQSTAQKLTIGANSWVMTSYTGTSKTVKKFLGKVLCVEDDDALVTFCRYKRGVCTWPTAEDKGWMSRVDLEVIRPPTFDRRDRMIFPEDVLKMLG